MAKGDPKTEAWLYAGRRLNAKGRVIHAWQPPGVEGAGDLIFFAKLPGSTIGGVYEVDVSRVDGGVTAHGRPRFVGEPSERVADPDVVRGWLAEDAAAVHDQAVAREEKRAAADATGELEGALDVLRAHFHACPTYSAKWAFAQWVAAQVAKPVRGPR